MTIKEALESGYKLYEEKYKNGVRYYSIQKPKNKNVKAYLGDVSIITGKKLVRLFGAKIVPATKTSIALNYTPTPPSHNCIRYWTDKIINQVTV